MAETIAPADGDLIDLLGKLWAKQTSESWRSLTRQMEQADRELWVWAIEQYQRRNYGGRVLVSIDIWWEDPDLGKSLAELLGDVQIKIWFCPNEDHHEEMVEWRGGGDIAYCLAPGCRHNSGEGRV
jgi:hypothetical protein